MNANAIPQFKNAQRSTLKGRLPDRQQRFPNLIGMPPNGHETLNNLKIAVAGCGAVGRTIAIDLARLGIAKLLLIDPKKYKAQSLLTQQISPAEVGRSKAESTANACAEISHNTEICFHADRFETLGHLALEEVNLVIMAGDNLRLESAVGQWTSLFQIPLIHAAVHGETLVAQIHVYSNQGAESPCPCCGWGAAEWDHHARETTFACDPASVSGSPQEAIIATQPTTSTPSLCGIAANLASTQMLRFVLGLGKPVGDTSLQFCAFTNKTVTSPLHRHEECPTNHRPYARFLLPTEPTVSLNDLLKQTKELWSNDDPPTFELGNQEWVEAGLCHCKSAPTPIARFASVGASKSCCESCGSSLSKQPFFTHSRASLQHLGKALDASISTICDAMPEWIVIRNSENAALLTQLQL